MSLVLVITVAYLALADAGYQYNAPSVSLSLPGNPPANFQGGSQHQAPLPNNNDKPLSYSISYKDYVYIKKDNVNDNNQHHHSVNRLAGNGGILASPGVHPVSTILNNGYAQPFASSPEANLHSQYAQTSTLPGINSHNNYVTNFIPANHNSQNLAPIVSGNINSGYSPSSLLPSGNVEPVGNNLNGGYTYNYPPITTGNSNSGYSQISASSGVNSNIDYSHNTPSVGSNINSGYASSSSAATNLNTDYVNTFALPANINLNSGHIHDSFGANVNNGYLQASSGNFDHGNAPIPHSSNVNTGSQTLTQSSSTSASNGYAQSSIPSVGANLNTLAPSGTGSLYSGYGQKSIPSAANLNSVYQHTSTPSNSVSSSYDYLNQNPTFSNSITQSGTTNLNDAQPPISSTGANLNTGHSHYIAPSGAASLSNGYAQSSVSSASSNLNAGYQRSSIPFGSNGLTSGYSQASSDVIGANLNTGYAQSSINVNLNGGYVQNLIPQSSLSSFGTTINSINALAGSINEHVDVNFSQRGLNNDNNTPVNPAIYKHIYLHVPPPEVEEQRILAPPPPPKKNYKILFIKVPSQESKSNVARLQQMAEIRNAAAAVEHKTLIYVLVKNPETQQPVVISKQTPSKHEVFFVKYNGNPLELAAQVNQELDSSGSVQSVVPLEPGLVNGQK